MLNGWVLTDNSCPNLGCHIPLMRSPNGRTPITHYCANCDENPTSRSTTSNTLLPSEQAQSSPSISSCSRHTRSSTPPTDFSSTLSSPIFASPVETAESLRRRQQSDTASSEIGKRLLKGWAMLAEECPNVRCFGVPLVRPPKAGGGKDPRKECVICGTVYVSENNSSGWEELVPVNPGVPEQVQKDTTLAPSSGQEPATSTSRNKGETVADNEVRQMPNHAVSSTIKPSGIELPWVQAPHSMEPIAQTAQKNKTISALEVAANSLELSLHTLSERLTFLSSGQSPLNAPSIAEAAEAINKVTEALAQVKRLHWSESRVPP